MPSQTTDVWLIPSLCPEAEERSRMSDQDFWAHVFPQTTPEYWDVEPSSIDLDDMATFSGTLSPCPECGQHGACAYDAEGRAMIHVTPTED